MLHSRKSLKIFHFYLDLELNGSLTQMKNYVTFVICRFTSRIATIIIKILCLMKMIRHLLNQYCLHFHDMLVSIRIKIIKKFPIHCDLEVRKSSWKIQFHRKHLSHHKHKIQMKYKNLNNVSIVWNQNTLNYYISY